MFTKNYTAALVVSSGLAMASIASGAMAADMPIKAPPPEPFVLDVHGFFDISLKNDYITPRGLLVTNTGLTTQVLMGLALDIYKNKYGFINNIGIYGGVWNDLWSKQNHPTAGSWNEFDWFTGATVKFGQNWKLGVEYIEFLSPPGNFRIERNLEISLAYDDSSWNPWIPFNPYVKWFNALSGSSTVVVGKMGGTYDVELGVVPTLDMGKNGYPVVFSAPTWVTVGPESYWNRGITGCGTLATTPCSLSNTGVVSSGLTAKVSLESWIPKRLGSWYAKGGFQHYHMLNDSLLLAQTFVGTAATYNTAHRDVTVGFGGVGFGF